MPRPITRRLKRNDEDLYQQIGLVTSTPMPSNKLGSPEKISGGLSSIEPSPQKENLPPSHTPSPSKGSKAYRRRALDGIDDYEDPFGFNKVNHIRLPVKQLKPVEQEPSIAIYEDPSYTTPTGSPLSSSPQKSPKKNHHNVIRQPLAILEENEDQPKMPMLPLRRKLGKQKYVYDEANDEEEGGDDEEEDDSDNDDPKDLNYGEKPKKQNQRKTNKKQKINEDDTRSVKNIEKINQIKQQFKEIDEWVLEEEIIETSSSQ